ncbi:AAA family ATPase [Cellulomonas fimi]|uniref:Putative NadR-like transcriptional regulator n=1 Tax=Cellulomonas fimi (strain ATCC 484 / DSM 20113 / JCM 1341 / CCUG 24087 / LMG 16345 / NBRC 15513 / NCIMB 8980 / NCTC 7547 / NRS-133) TaxID=590998 RepID=F4H6H7_CELFA|nr:AAA family ATPase [Cellulomonas fimi]AEE45610.1 putative NadR-like transcriptional regulator [Cellulomonas fimi ATCC 484]NNH05882.1 AAA family ATPase [Cellulomonas fimi]VEH30059.1 Trifunctional NAD biosynthesis/regulator protein NadR [Cellulomonas fimi]
MTAFAHGLVIGKFYPPHAGHLALVRAALARCARVTVQVLASSQESLPAELRARWLRDELPGAHVVHGLDDAPVDYASEAAWQAHTAVIEGLLDAPVDALFSSDDYGEELARRLGARWVQVDPGRRGTPVSARAVRADPGAYWWALPAAVRAWFVRRVVVIGAESTGTTTLAEALTAHLGLPTVAEFGREWSEIRPGGFTAPWHTAEFDLVAREQARTEDDAAARTPVPLLVCDTDVLATAVWHERYVGRPSPSVRSLAARRVPDLYLLTGDEIPFVQDGLRDGEHLRHAMQDRFREVLAEQEAAGGAPWVELRGDPGERLAAALALVEPLRDRPRPLAEPMEQRHEQVPDLAAALALPHSGP